MFKTLLVLITVFSLSCVSKTTLQKIDLASFQLDEFCSGTLLEDGYFLTAEHCIVKIETKMVNTIFGKMPVPVPVSLPIGSIMTIRRESISRKARVVSKDPKQDIAILKVLDRAGLPKGLKIAKDVQKYETLHSFGYPAGTRPSTYASFQYRGVSGDYSLFNLFSGLSYGGQSGSSIVDSNGEVVGMINMGISGSELTLGSRLEAIEAKVCQAKGGCNYTEWKVLNIVLLILAIFIPLLGIAAFIILRRNR